VTVVDDAQLVRDMAAFIITTRDKTGIRPGTRVLAEHFDVSRHKIRLLARWVDSEVAARTTSPTVARPVARATRRASGPGRRRPAATPVMTRPARLTQPAPTAPPAGEGGGRKRVSRWPLLLIAAPASVAIWGGWVELGKKAGFGPVQLLPGLADFTVNLAITLPIGLEIYAAYAMMIWLGTTAATPTARRFAAISSLTALLIGASGQIAYHLLEAANIAAAPWLITASVAVLPVAVLGMAAALAHLTSHTTPTPPSDEPSGRPRATLRTRRARPAHGR
jgi:hypothetical protein